MSGGCHIGAGVRLPGVMRERWLAHGGSVAPDSSLCASRGCHIAGVCGVDGFVVGLFSGFLCASGVALVAMCEWRLSHWGLCGVLAW